MNINEYIQKKKAELDGSSPVIPRVVCKDGFEMSVQAGEYLYSSPRAECGRYDKVEIGFPSDADKLITPYAEYEEVLTDTVYGYVPVETVDELIQKHGGIKNE